MPRRFSGVAGFGPLRMEGGTPRRTGTMVRRGLKDWERASVRAFSCGEERPQGRGAAARAAGGRKGRPYMLIFVANAKVGPRERYNEKALDSALTSSGAIALLARRIQFQIRCGLIIGNFRCQLFGPLATL